MGLEEVKLFALSCSMFLAEPGEERRLPIFQSHCRTSPCLIIQIKIIKKKMLYEKIKCTVKHVYWFKLLLHGFLLLEGSNFSVFTVNHIYAFLSSPINAIIDL